MRRRTILAFATVLFTGSPAVLAQQRARTFRIGAFTFDHTAVLREHMQIFRERLRQFGFVEGRNLHIVEEASSIDVEARRRSAENLIRSKPDLLLSFGSTNTRVLQELSERRIPIVFTMVGDAVAYGIVKELGRPGGNTTGATFLQREMTVKRMELVRDMLPKARRIVVAAYGRDVTYKASEPLLKQLAARLGFELALAELSDSAPDVAVGKALESPADAVLVYQPISFVVGRDASAKVAQVAMARRIPVFFAEPDLVALGGLLSYGPDFLDETRRAADLVAKVLKGANAGDLPVDQSTRFQLVVNVRTAKTLGIEIPQSVRSRIDRVID
jgi:putative ABC transport system substrate-binding protein